MKANRQVHQKRKPSFEGLQNVRASVYLAKEVVGRLGRGKILLRKMQTIPGKK
jgi:hypothetical protein